MSVARKTILIGLGLIWAAWVTAAADPPTTHTFRLRHVENGIAFSSELLPATTQIKKEPQYAGSKVVRGMLLPGAGGRAPLLYAWDVSGKKIYIDRNRNLDLTDETPEGKSDDTPIGDVFSGIKVENHAGSMTLPYTLKLTSYSTVYRSLEINSGWRGVMELGDQPYTIDYVDDLNGVVDSNDGFAVDNLPPAARQNLPEALVLDGAPYRLSLRFVAAAGACEVEGTLAPITESLGTLQNEGRGVARMTLLEGTRRVLLISPGERAQVPAGSWIVQSLIVHAASGENFTGTRYRSASFSGPGPLEIGYKIAAGETTRLKLGAPLNNVLIPKVSGPMVEMKYGLTGVGGESYTPDSSQQKTTEFAIYHKGKQIGAGKFEYG